MCSAQPHRIHPFAWREHDFSIQTKQKLQKKNYKQISIMKKLFLLLLLLCGAMNSWAEVVTGNCGTNVTYTLDTESGVLEISGTGEMEDYDWSHYAPWKGETVKSIIIQNSVTSIGRLAFYSCSDLTTVTIPNSVTCINQNAFHSCSSLTSLTIPNSVTSIGIAAFYGCSKLTTMNLPNSVTSIGNSAFSGCM